MYCLEQKGLREYFSFLSIILWTFCHSSPYLAHWASHELQVPNSFLLLALPSYLPAGSVPGGWSRQPSGSGCSCQRLVSRGPPHPGSGCPTPRRPQVGLATCCVRRWGREWCPGDEAHGGCWPCPWIEQSLEEGGEARCQGSFWSRYYHWLQVLLYVLTSLKGGRGALTWSLVLWTVFERAEYVLAGEEKTRGWGVNDHN